MRIVRILLSVAVAAGATAEAWSRPVRVPDHNELFERAEIVVVAVVTEIKDTGKSSTIQPGASQPSRIKIMHARLNVLHTIKGRAPEEMLFRYEPLDHEKMKLIINGPMRIFIEEGKSYLMYLMKKPKADYYIGVFDGSYDDGFAVKSVAPLRTPAQMLSDSE